MNELTGKTDWPMQIVDRMDRFYDEFFGELSHAIDEHYLKDGWQFNATLQAIKPVTSTLHWPKLGKIKARARFIGGLLGHSVAHYEALCQPKTWSIISRSFNVLLEFEARLSGTNIDPVEADENPFLDELPAFQSALGCCVKIASRQSRDEQVQFFEGYAKALRKGSLTLDGRPVGESTRTTAFQLIAVFGPVLRLHLRSVGDVHRFLERCLGSNRAGSLKRTEAICKTLGMKFRGSGRPSAVPELPP